MPEQGAYGERLSGRFGVHDVPVLVSSALMRTPIAVTLVESQVAADVMSEPLPPEDAFLVHLNLKACPDHELWVGGRALGKRRFSAGETAIHDLKQDPRALVRTPMGSMMFYLSRQVLNETCDDAEARRVDDLHWVPGIAVDDPTVRSLARALLGPMKNPYEATPLFIDHVTRALAVHVAAKYGGMSQVGASPCGGLAGWQERRAKELLAAHPDGELSLLLLAGECGLSVGHFTRSFRRSFGEPPHRWLQRQRAERAKSLLRDAALSLAEVAIACGYYDQSHLTRCFRNAFGVTPGAWRRHHGVRSPALPPARLH
jgi:AraC-like DNA-binding protein